MEKKAKRNILIMLFLVVILCKMVFMPANEDSIKKQFGKNKSDMLKIVDYLVDFDYKYMYMYIGIGMDMDELSIVTEADDIAVNDMEVVGMLRRLKNNNYILIEKDNTIISFLCWRNKDCGRGIVYSIDGHIPDNSSLPFLTKLEALEESDWYYYEEDFNEWKLRGGVDTQD